MTKVIVNRQSRSTLLLSISDELRTGLYWRTEVLHGAPARKVSTRRKGPRPETRRRDLLDRDETRDAQVRDRDETETLSTLSETRPRRDVSTSRDRDVETETTSLVTCAHQRIRRTSAITLTISLTLT